VQRTVEELDASNEEMKSTNEELQSTNEEIETSKEELQSLNEELQTVNSELEDKIQDLSTSNDDLNNLLNATNIGTIFLDTNFCIKRFTEQATRVVHLIPTDVGRELSDLTSKLQYEQLLSDAKDVLETLNSCEREVQTLDGRWLLMRILPYRTEDKRIDGLVMTFVDIDDTTRAR
jgi:two-component system CheB/CheR fusion protein